MVISELHGLGPRVPEGSQRERERERESLENKNSKDYVGVFESFLNSLAVF
jgi:hypothetical protein